MSENNNNTSESFSRTLVDSGFQTEDGILSTDHNLSCASSFNEDESDIDTGSSSLKSVDSESISSQSTCYNSSASTRRNSSDLEIPLQLLFRSSSSVSSQSRIDSPVSANILDGADRLLHRLTSERFLELRRIQLGERPVTGSNAREILDSFFHRAIHGPTEQQRQVEEEANRPEHVTRDVESLLQQSVVQSALQTGFRSHLERTLSSRIQTGTTLLPNESNVRLNNSHTSQTQLQRNLVGNPSFRSRLERLFGQQQTQAANHETSNHRNIITRNNLSQRNTTPPPPPPLPPVEISQPQPSNLQITLEAGLQLLTETITEDIGRLQSLQIVSNMLNADFRNELENMVQQRVQTVGNGPSVEEFVRSLPGTRRPHIQRQSSELQSAINSNVSSEINALRHELMDMKAMMAMTMEIQMDTQRAIRQEVSAIFSTFMQEYLIPRAENAPTTQPTICHPRRTNPISAGQCVICIDKNVDTLLYQCGHMCVCNQCGLQLKMDGHNCPICRAPIRDVIRAYQTQ